MADLDLAAIRRRYEHSGEQAPDSTTWANRLFASSADVPALLAEVEQLRANQLPDGGRWVTEYGKWDVDFESVTWWAEPHYEPRRSDTHSRRVWRGPAKPITDTKPSAPR